VIYEEFIYQPNEADAMKSAGLSVRKSHPESPNGLMESLGFEKYWIKGRLGRNRHIYVKGDLKIELNNRDDIYDYIKRETGIDWRKES
jgi:hypothetical protein